MTRINTVKHVAFRRWLNLARASGRRFANHSKRGLIRRITQNQVHHFKRTFVNGPTDVKDTVIFNGATNYKLSSLPAYAEYTSLFDQYKIVRVKEIWYFDKNTSEMTSTSGSADLIPIMTHVIDYDDSAPLTTEAQFLQYENARINLMDKKFSRTIVPRVAASVYNGAFAGYSNIKAPWIDCSTPDVQHYGFKFMIDASGQGGIGNNTVGQYKRYTTIWFDCRNTR